MDKEGAELPRKPLGRDKLAREKVFLAEQATEGGLKVLPGTKWAFHYPKGAEVREQAISNLLSGKINPLDVAADLKPDVLLYDVKDIEEQGLSAVTGRVRDASAQVAYYDYLKFALFVSEMQGTGIIPDTAQSLYDGIAQSRIRKKMLDAYGDTGRKQMEDALRIEAERTVQQIGNLPRVEKVLAALKMNWLAEDQLARTEQRDQAVGQLSVDERQLYDQLKDPYQGYVRKGDQSDYESLVNGVKENIPRIQQAPEEPKKDESQEQLERELKQYKDQAVPPVTPGDTGIPPEDSDEYHTPSTPPWESEEEASMHPYFEIIPSGTSTKPMTGYYASGRKSYYDIDKKTWSKRKQLFPYSGNISGKNRQTISGAVGNGLTSIPIPNGYGLDMPSLKARGGKAEILRDQNGCFYVKTNGAGTFSIDFLKENPVFVGRPIAEDILPIHRGLLSSETERIMASLQGSDLEKAEQLNQYLLSKHFYPGDGDLQMAQALQLKLRNESSGADYIQNLDASEYLECYSANTLFIAMLRKAGIPSRLVIGHRVQGAKEGKANINSTTGHAWTEVWDGNSWRRIDATPNPKQQKQDQKGDQNSPSQEAQDGGIDKQDQGQQQGQGQSQQGQGSQSGESMPGQQMQQMGEASDQDIAQGESQLDNAQELSKHLEQQKQNIDKRLENAQSFQDLKKLEQEAQNSDLFDDMKQDLQQRLEAKEEQMKDEIKENLDEMEKDGFLDDERRQELEEQLDNAQLEELDRISQQIERENRLFNEYQDIKEEVLPLVDRWFDYFAERLPRQEDVETDEDSLTRQGSFNRHSVMKPRNLLFGTVKNPRVIKPSIKPKFLASVMVDVSGSMGGAKLDNARKMLVFYNELFSRIGEEFGFIRYSNNIFSDNIVEVKKFDQDYQSPTRYDWIDGTRSTVKVRLMQQLHVQEGTNMLPAIQKAAKDLSEETLEYPDYASALYFVGDGGDTSGNAQRIKEFLQLDSEQGFGQHMLSAIMLGDESQRRALADIFGDEHTTVAPDFETLIEQSMYKFYEDTTAYLQNKTV